MKHVTAPPYQASDQSGDTFMFLKITALWSVEARADSREQTDVWTDLHLSRENTILTSDCKTKLRPFPLLPWFVNMTHPSYASNLHETRPHVCSTEGINGQRSAGWKEPRIDVKSVSESYISERDIFINLQKCVWNVKQKENIWIK